MRVVARIVLALVLLVGVLPTVVWAQPVPKQGDVVRVATRVLPPFVVQDANGKLGGFSIELWERLAERTGVRTEYIIKPSLSELLGVVRDGSADLAIAAISITAQRESSFDFSHPMYDSGLAILVPEGVSQVSMLSLLLQWSSQLLPALGLGLFLIFVPAHVIWFVERRGGSPIDISQSYFPGIFKTAFWVACLMGGQAEGFPKRAFSRVISIMGIYIGLVFVAYFTAFATSTLTVQQLKSGISSPSDLAGRVASTVEGSTAHRFLNTLQVESVTFRTVAEAIAAVEHGKAAAVVYDSPILRYYVLHEGRGKVRLAGPTFRQEKYGILFPQGSNFRKRVNEELLRLREDGTYQEIQLRWFGSEETS
ncbi:ABC transporter substrate-binding protein [Paramagnetospirillum kuznetsovii]|uniref:ABC transporter substrate-binding protein n=1 Tax=Paramagnetospirillum kuznetsovii TaxID=2053833 RepID=A0A364P3E4_9PROT|nr:transporter substrate-binding domain-containing protein [Paramagnetospirillum kuznetsovii]RAU23868.1 ABC transporter substrate-binding protein [Paramagnetospirillum kuznetsovii]